MSRKIFTLNCLSIITLTVIGITYLDAFGGDIMKYKDINDVSKQLLIEASANIDIFNITIESFKSKNNEVIYAVRYNPKRSPEDLPMAGGGYSIYFKKEDGQFILIRAVKDQ